MKIVTGHTGTPHVTASDAASFNRAIIGPGSYVMDVGARFNTTMTSAEVAAIEDGDGVMQGVHFRIDPGTVESVSISPGTAGYNRIDLICARYTKASETGIEGVDLVVIQGTPSAGTPAEPSYNNGDIRSGASIVDMPLYRVTLSGVSPTLTRVAKIEGIHRSSLLWESVATTGSTLTVDLDLSEYDYIDVEYWYSSASGTAPAVQRHPVGKTTKAFAIGMGTAISIFTRDVTVLQNNVVFGAITYGRYYDGAWSLGADTMNLLPVKIYGVAY